MSSKRRRRSSLMKAVSFRERLTQLEQAQLRVGLIGEKSELGDIESHVSEKIDMFERLAQLLDPKYKYRVKLGQPHKTKEEEIKATIDSLRDQAQAEVDRLNDQLKDQRKTWESRLEDAELEMCRLRGELAAAKVSRKELEEQLNEAKVNQSRELQEKSDNKEQELQLLKQRLSEADTLAQLRDDLLCAQTAKEKLVSEQTESQLKFNEERSALLAEIESLRVAKAASDQSNDVLREQSTEIIEDLRRQLAERDSENEKLISHMKLSITELQIALTYSREIESAANRKLEERISDLRARQQAELSSCSLEYENRISSAQEEVLAAQNDMKVLADTVSKLLSAYHSEKSYFQREIAEAKAELQSLTCETRQLICANVCAAEQEIGSLRSEHEIAIEVFAEEMAAMRCEVEETKREKETLREEFIQRFTEASTAIRTELEEAHETNNSLQKELTETKEKLHETITALRLEVEEVKSEKSAAEKELKKSQRKSEELCARLLLQKSDLDEMNAQIVSLRTQQREDDGATKRLREISAERDVLQKKLEESRAEIEATQLQSCSFEKELANSKIHFEQLSSSLRTQQGDLQSRNASLQKELEDTRSASHERCSSLQNELDASKSLKLSLEKQLEELQSNFREISSAMRSAAQEEIAELSSSVSQLTEKLRTEEKRMSLLKSQLEAERAVNDQLSQSLSVSEEKAKSLESERELFQSKLSESISQQKILSEQVEKEFSRSQSLQIRLTESLQKSNQREDEIENLQLQLSERDTEINQISQRFGSLKRENQTLISEKESQLCRLATQKLWNRIEFEAQLSQKNAEIERLEAVLSKTIVRSLWRKVEIAAQLTQLKRVKSSLKKLKSEGVATRKRLSEANFECLKAQNDKDSASSQIRSKQRQIENLLSETAQKQKQIDALLSEKSIAANQISALELQMYSANSEIESLRSEKDAISSELASLSQRLESAQQHRSNLRTANDSLSAEIANLKKSLKTIELDYSKKFEVEKQNAANELAHAKNQLRSVESELIRAQRKADSAEKKNADLARLAEMAKLELSAAQIHFDEEIRRLNIEHAEILRSKVKTTQEEMKSQICELQTHLRQSQADLKVSEQRLSANRVEISKLSAENEKALSENDDLSKKVLELESKSAENSDSLKREISALTSKLRDADLDCRKTQAELDRALALVTHYRTHFESLSSSASSESKSIALLQSQIESAKAERAQTEKLVEMRARALEETIASDRKERELDQKRSALRLNALRIQKEEIETSLREKELLLRSTTARLQSLETLLAAESSAHQNAKQSAESLESLLATAKIEAAKVPPMEETIVSLKFSNEHLSNKVSELSSAVSSRDATIAEISLEKQKLASNFEELKYDLSVLHRQIQQIQQQQQEKQLMVSPAKTPLSPVVESDANKSAQKRKLSASARRAIDFKNLNDDNDDGERSDSPQIAFKPGGMLKRQSAKELKTKDPENVGDSSANRSSTKDNSLKRSNSIEQGLLASPTPKPPVPRFTKEEKTTKEDKSAVPPSQAPTSSATPRRGHRRGLSINLSPQVSDGDIANSKKSHKLTSAFASKTARFENAIPDPTRYDRSWKAASSADVEGN